MIMQWIPLYCTGLKEWADQKVSLLNKLSWLQNTCELPKVKVQICLVTKNAILITWAFTVPFAHFLEHWPQADTFHWTCSTATVEDSVGSNNLYSTPVLGYPGTNYNEKCNIDKISAYYPIEIRMQVMYMKLIIWTAVMKSNEAWSSQLWTQLYAIA